MNFLAQYKERQDVKMFLEILLSLTTISAFSILALRPTVLTITRLIKEIESKKELVVRMDEKIQKLSEAQALYDQQIEKIQLLATSIPKKPSPEHFVRQIEGLSAKHEASVTAMSVDEMTLMGSPGPKQVSDSESPPQTSANEVSFSISATASYSSLLNYLSDMEKVRRPVKFDLINLKSTNMPETKVLILIVEGKTPYYYERGENDSL